MVIIWHMRSLALEHNNYDKPQTSEVAPQCGGDHWVTCHTVPFAQLELEGLLSPCERIQYKSSPPALITGGFYYAKILARIAMSLNVTLISAAVVSKMFRNINCRKFREQSDTSLNSSITRSTSANFIPLSKYFEGRWLGALQSGDLLELDNVLIWL